MLAQEISRGIWLNEPDEMRQDGSSLFVTAKENSDFWRKTSYGFIHNSGHALLNDFPQDSAVELSWVLDYKEQFDQAGLLIWSDEDNWTKAGVEFADGAPQLGAVVTKSFSDWSVAPVSDWMGKVVHLRASRSDDALTIRAKCDGDWKLVRLSPLDPKLDWKVGLHLASPSRAGLTVKFIEICAGPADETLH
jgi:regulation of enolase protein 1 (concanavalin A-like superfamily)